MVRLLLFFILSCTIFSAQIEKNLIYKKYTLKDEYSYNGGSKKIKRTFQWNKISDKLDNIKMFQENYQKLGYLANYKNNNGTAPSINGKTVDRFGTSRNQAIPIYKISNLSQPDFYGKDGSLVAILDSSQNYSTIKIFDKEGTWVVPNKYLKVAPTNYFNKVVVVDRKNQHVALLENENNIWKVRSMTPATTGKNNPPYSQPTPLGLFVVQQKKYKMDFYADGTEKIAGYAPYATRFTRGAYLHGIPVNLPNTQMVEYAGTLGTVPRSHMCVRNPTSLAQLIYDWAPVGKSLVLVIE
jgi:lipoprotein-anchoring transpeptidase ErfK/SrfK